jgi:hypothetical protein
MAKARIFTTTGDEIVRDVKSGEEEFYDDLPFNSDNVMITEIRSD